MSSVPAMAAMHNTVVLSQCDDSELQMTNTNDDDVCDSKTEPSSAGISFFEKYLTVWVFLCMAIGGLIGYFAPITSASLAICQFAEINAIVAVFLWLMVFPMMVQIDFNALGKVKENPGAIALTSCINYLVKPFTMYALAILFFRVFYVSVIPDALLRDNYIAGLILLAGAPCAAMVFVWSLLTGGDPAYTLVQVNNFCE